MSHFADLPLIVERECACCGRQVVRQRSRVPASGRVFCSRTCWLRTHNTPERNAEISRRARGNADHQRDRGEGKTYRKLYGRHEHRVVAEQMLGRPLQPGEVVHHVNGDKRDNRPENLQVFASHADHGRHHAELARRAKVAA